MIWIILLTIYLVSAFFVWLHTHLAYLENGIFNGIDIRMTSLILTFLPWLNTISALVAWIMFYPIEGKKIINLNKFFCIKD